MPKSIIVMAPMKALGLCIMGLLGLSVIGSTSSNSTGNDVVQECCAAGIDCDDRTCTARESKAIDDVVDCTIYMAPSTIGDRSNLGIYTAAPLKFGDTVPYPEIVIPFLWRVFGVHPEQALTDGELWDRYIWKQQVGRIEAFDDLARESERASVFIPGVGCTVNSMLDLSNIHSARGSQFDEVVDRTSPGAGSFTPYHSCATTVSAIQGIEAGQELFASYGDQWIPWIPDVAVTFDENFAKVDDLMDEFEAWIVQHEEAAVAASADSELSEDLLEAMWKFMVNFPYRSRSLSVLPKEWSRERLQRKQKLASASSPSMTSSVTSTSKEYWAAKGKVSIEFLKEHGKCQDHIRPDISTLPHAGRGAFATRDLPKGTVVGYAPLVHVAIRGDNIFQVSYNHDGTNQSANKQAQYTRPDMIVNYSFGHKNSTIYLTPYGAMVNYINHKSTNDGANVRVQWPPNDMVAHKPEWLTKDISFLRDTVDKIGLSFDFVATRDIKKGEEIFMDYGDEWSKAWEEHVKTWEPPEDAKGYVHSTKYQVEFLRTSEELETNPYPWNLHTLCTDSYRKDPTDDTYTYEKSVTMIKDRVPCRVLERRQLSLFHQDRFQLDNGAKFVYTVELTIPDRDNGNKLVVVRDFPRNDNGINLYDKAYSQSWHLENAFRHKIYIPDDIIPLSWQNV